MKPLSEKSQYIQDLIKENQNLKIKVVNQAYQLQYKDTALQTRNQELDALHYVWCSGGCPGGIHRYAHEVPITEELVQLAEKNTRRLRRWHDAANHRLEGTSGGYRERLLKKLGISEQSV